MRNVLLVDDDAAYRRSLIARLRNHDYTFHEAGSPAEAIALLEANPSIRVILLDLRFPTGSGRSFLAHIRDRATHFRVIVLTEVEKLLDAEDAGEYSVFHYLPKTKQSSQAIRFSLDNAFKDVERADLNRKLAYGGLEETLNLVCHVVRSGVSAYTCHIRLYDFNKGDYHTVGFAAADPTLRGIFVTPRAKGKLFSGKVVETGKPEVFADLQNTPEFQEFKEHALQGREVPDHEKAYWDGVASAYIVPVVTGVFEHGVDAVLNVSSDKIEFFDAHKCAVIDEMAIHAALAVSKHWLQEKREEVHADYREISHMLSNVSARLKSPSDVTGICEVVTSGIAKIVSPEIVSVFLLDKKTGLLRNVAELRGDERQEDLDESYRPGQSFTGWVFEKNRTLHLPPKDDPAGKSLVDDGRFDRPKTADYLRDIPSQRIEHYLGVPIRIGGRPRGVLRAVNKKSKYYDRRSAAGNPLCLLERGFSRDCRNAVEIAANHVAVAIRNAELIGQKERQLEQIRALTDVGRLIGSELKVDEVLRRSIRAMANVIDAQICMLFLRNRTGDRIVLEQTYGIPLALLAGAHYRVGEGVTGKVAATGEPALIGRAVENNGRYDAAITAYLSREGQEARRVESLMVVPIKAKEHILGVMKVVNKRDHLDYDAEDLEFFGALADQVGVALFNARDYTELNDQLSRAARNNALSLLVRSVVHEINNTSGVIPANIDTIRQRLGTTEPVVDAALTRIQDAANQATDFANEIGGYSVKRRRIRRPRDINKLIATALDGLDLDRYDPHGRISLVRDLPGTLRCDVYSAPIVQVVKNIVINAYEALAGRSTGTVRVSTALGSGDSEGMAVVEIRDDGPGIHPDNINRIFEPEFTTRESGNGIGLYLVETQLGMMGGSIRVESEFGSGATFLISLPLARHGSST